MKNKRILFGLVGALMLSACNIGTGEESKLPASTSGIESSIPVASSSDAPVDSAQLLSDFVTNLGNKKQSMTFDLGSGAFKATFVGDGGLSIAFRDVRTFGYVKNSQGWFDYNLADGEIVLASLKTFDTSLTAYDFFLYSFLLLP